MAGSRFKEIGNFGTSYLKDKLLHIASISSPNFLGDNYRQNAIENDEYFRDENGAEFAVDILSSNGGVEWRLTSYPDDKEIVKNIRCKVKRNEF